VRDAISQQSAVMTALDLIDRTDWRVWTIGPSARSLLSRASMLADLRRNDESVL
jgi:hypothetical protein